MDLHLETERLLLRPLAATDIDWGIEMFTDPDVMRYLTDGHVPTAREVIAELPYALRRCAGGCIGVWAIELTQQARSLGTTFLLPLPIDEIDTNWDLVVGDALPDAEIEIGYVLRKGAWGKGFATEAAGGLTRFAFEQSPLQELVAVVDGGNAASRNVLRKIGFREEGQRRAYAHDCLGFRLRKQDWLAQAAPSTAR